MALKIIHGDIAKVAAKVIVNSTTAKLDLSSGPVSRSILSSGGASLQTQIAKDYPNGISTDKLAVTNGGDLPCDKIFHLALPAFWSKDGLTEKKLRNLILLCLQEADKALFESISFPALGTGILKYPPEIVARCFCETADSFHGDSLTDIYIVLHKGNKVVVEAFEKEVERNLSEKTEGSFRVSVVKGDITQQDVDVIVNSTTSSLNLACGPVSQAILKAGGQGIQDECKSKYPKGIKTGDIAETSGGDMPCQNVYHANLPIVTESTQAEEALLQVIKKCLTTAASKGKKSIAFPVIGTGVLKTWYPRDVVAKCVFKSFDDFSSSNVDTSLTESRIVVHPKDVENVLIFEDMTAALAAPGQSAIFTSFEATETCTAQAAAGISREVQLPAYWSKMSEQEYVSTVQLNPGHKEYQTVAQEFTKGTKYTIVKIERIQNCALHRQYQIQAECMGKRNAGQNAERHLWHGTSGDAVSSINIYGFSRSYTGKNATLYGEGSYFAVRPSLSTLYSPLDSDGYKLMYQASVLTGHYTKGASGMRVPPVREKDIKYDTVVDNPDNPGQFVVFHDAQAYPKYLVTFK